MAAWCGGIESCKRQQDLLLLGWTQQFGGGGVTGIVGNGPARLTSRTLLSLTGQECVKWSTFSTCTGAARARSFLIGDGSTLKWDSRQSRIQARGLWGETVSQLCDGGHVTEAVEALGVLVQTDGEIPTSLLYKVVRRCVVEKNLVLGRRVHAFIVKKGYESDTFLGNHILRMYASHGRLQEAMDVFSAVEEADAFMWSSVIAAHVRQGQDKEAIRLYRRMRVSRVRPDGHVFVAALQACARGLDLEAGQEVHADVLAGGVQPDVFVCNCLVDMYAKCGSLEDAERVFHGLGEKTVVTWNAMIAGYSQKGMGQKALDVYRAMQGEGLVEPDSVTFACLLQACASVGTPALERGRELHAQIRDQGHEADVFVASSLVNMYAKCGSVGDAQRVFDRLGHKNVVTWTTMIAGYSQQGMGQEALRLYAAMQEEGIAVPDAVTFACLLQACANVAALHLGRQLHAQIKERRLQADVFIAGSLISMYGKSGSMGDAQEVFDAMHERDVIAWSALIAGYTSQGNSEMVFHLFHRMVQDGIRPTGTTFLSLLTVCSYTGLVSKGQEYFQAMSPQHGIRPGVEHYTCLVDLLGRAGRLDEALVLVRSMPVPPDATVWSTLLGACQKWSNVDVGRYAFDEAVKLDKKDPAAYVLMLNIYGGAQMWEQAQEMQTRRVGTGAWKQPGQSCWTDMDGLVHIFRAGHEKHEHQPPGSDTKLKQQSSSQDEGAGIVLTSPMSTCLIVG